MPFSALLSLCGVGAALLHTVLAPPSDAPLIGASGAVGGVLAAYIVLYPEARVWILALHAAAVAHAGRLVLGRLVRSADRQAVPRHRREQVDVAWWAHIGGFATGFVLTLLLRSRLLLRAAP